MTVLTMERVKLKICIRFIPWKKFNSLHTSDSYDNVHTVVDYGTSKVPMKYFVMKYFVMKS